MRRHRVLKVMADGMPWLCDVGVGGPCPLRPLCLQEGIEQHQGDESYRLAKDPFLGGVVEELRKGDWSHYYSFTEEVQLPLDYVMPSYWCEHAPDSIFTQSIMISVRTPDGRITVSGDEIRMFSRNGVKAFTPSSEAERVAALQEWFGIVLD